MDQAPIDLLLVLAQIGVTAAGFCPLASVVGQTLSTAHPEVNAIRLRGLLKVPVLGTESARRGASHRWAPASSRRWSAMECSSEINPAPTRLPGYNRFTMVTNFSILDIVTIAFGCAASGLAIDFVGSPFVGALILMLVGCATAFILAVTPFLESPS